MTDLDRIAANIADVKARIAAAAQRAGRQPEDVTLVAVTKTYPAEYVAAAAHAGVTDMGENKVQEALPKITAISNDLSIDVRWHLIGHLQTNKAKAAVENFDLIHSVDSIRLAKEINRHAQAAGRIMPVLLQVNVSGEESKGGFEPGEVAANLQEILEGCEHLFIEGFMTMAPFVEPEQARPSFRALRELRDSMLSKISHKRLGGRHLSMGMSNDFEVAVEEGATMVRVGSSLFGARNYDK